MRIYKLIFFNISLLLSYSFFSQSNPIWGTYIGGNGNDYTNEFYDHSITTDNFGNTYIAGFTNGTSGISSNGFQNIYGGGAYDAFLIKFDLNGNRIWSTYYGGSGDDKAFSVSTDSSGNIYLVGFTSSVSNIAAGGFQNTYGGGSNDAFIVKFNSNGGRIWSSYYGGESDDPAWGVSTDNQGNIFITGTTNSNSNIAFGGHQNSLAGGGSDAYLVKFNSFGNRIWSTYFGGPGGEIGTSVVTDNNGNVFIGGYTLSTTGISYLGFQNSHANPMDNDAYLVKFDPLGSRIWSTYFGGVNTDSGCVLASDGTNVFLAGYTNNTAGIAYNGFQNNFGGGVYDAFLVKFDNLGNRIWSTYYGDQGTEYGNVSTDSFGNIILSGITSSEFNIASGGIQNSYGGGANDLFYVIFEPNGNRICSSYYGGSGNEYGGQTSVFGNKILLSGHTNSTSGIAVGGFQNTFGGGYADALLVKITSCFAEPCVSTSSTSNFTSCNPYTWNSITYNSSGTYIDTVQNVSGCDSVMTLNLIIYSVPNVPIIYSDQQGMLYTQNQQNATYQWHFCSDNIQLANEVNDTLIPPTSSLYYVTVQNQCGIDTSDCYFYQDVNIPELDNSFLKIFPNPSSKSIQIETSTYPKVFSILNYQGQLLSKILVENREQYTDIDILESGVYFFTDSVNFIRFIKD